MLVISKFKKMGRGQPSLTTHSLENLDESRNTNDQLEIIKDTAGIVFQGIVVTITGKNNN